MRARLVCLLLSHVPPAYVNGRFRCVRCKTLLPRKRRR